jgi:hypothetical protein
MLAEGKFDEIIAPLFAKPKGRRVKSGLRRSYTEMSAGGLYYNPAKLSASSTLEKLAAAIPKKNKSDVREWLEQLDAFTQHRPVRGRFLRNSYTVTNPMDV